MIVIERVPLPPPREHKLQCNMISSQDERDVTADDDTHVNVGLAQRQVQAVQRVGGVQEDGQQRRDDQEHGEVDRSVEHRPEPEGDQVPTWKWQYD